MQKVTKRRNFRNRTELSLADISRMYNPVLRGWYGYYGKYYPSALQPVWRHFNKMRILRLREHPFSFIVSSDSHPS